MRRASPKRRKHTRPRKQDGKRSRSSAPASELRTRSGARRSSRSGKPATCSSGPGGLESIPGRAASGYQADQICTRPSTSERKRPKHDKERKEAASERDEHRKEAEENAKERDKTIDERVEAEHKAIEDAEKDGKLTSTQAARRKRPWTNQAALDHAKVAADLGKHLEEGTASKQGADGGGAELAAARERVVAARRSSAKHPAGSSSPPTVTSRASRSARSSSRRP